MSHILHHHTMKFLLAFKSFQPRRPIVEISSENWFAAGCQFGSEAGFLQAANSAAKTGSLQAANSTAKLVFCRRPIQQRKLVCCRLLIRQRKLVRCRQLNFDSECSFAAADTVSAANHNFAAEHPIQQRMLIRYRNSVSAANHKFRCRTHDSAVNVNSLQTTQFRQRIIISLQNTKFGSEC